MRKFILIGVAAVALSACGGEQSAEERAAAERNVTSEVVQTNDTTAIDAATGEAANMAADVPFIPSLENELDGNEAEPTPPARRSAPAPRPRPQRPDTSEDTGGEPVASTNSL